MNIKLTLGERLKDLRVERNLKLETLAEQTGLSKSALSKYESDDVTDLSIYAVTTLAEFYGVTTDYLLGVTENKKRPDNMKRNHKKLLFSLSKITCAFAMAIAVLSVNSTCCFTAYQPDVPESLDRN